MLTRTGLAVCGLLLTALDLAAGAIEQIEQIERMLLDRTPTPAEVTSIPAPLDTRMHAIIRTLVEDPR